jgi:hypothetical protein
MDADARTLRQPDEQQGATTTTATVLKNGSQLNYNDT